ncbi:MAG: hypothetical protein KGQ52_06390 [Alphaproteobacteria bacterium]|nr:hypothetical protein [Alphaproteobacteria bacterium]
MARWHFPSSAPLYVAAGLCVLAIITAWPEPLAGGWQWATAVAAMLGGAASLPFWQAAGQAQRRQGKHPAGGAATAALAGMLVAGTLLHLANATMPGSPAREAVLMVTDKYVTRGRRGRTSHHVRTTPVPGMAAQSGRHSVGGLFGNSGGYDDYRIGGCMALRWRPGWWWPVVARRQAVPCPVAALAMARPGQAWPLVQQRLADGLAGLALPPAGRRVELVATTDANGMIIAIRWLNGATEPPDAVTRLITMATMRVPFALAGPAGHYRLWLKLLPAQPPAETGRI